MKFQSNTMDYEQVRKYAFWYYMRHRFYGIGLFCGALVPLGALVTIALALSLEILSDVYIESSINYLARVGIMVAVLTVTMIVAVVFGQISNQARDFVGEVLDVDDCTKQDIQNLYHSKFS